ncbi:CCA tRNA nucleotidyltransferase [Helicobacter pylori]|nr:CCA tRNA nucleotidyltransferase [Helicobacter pylori]
MFELDKELKELFGIYEKFSHELYLVGGCVRDCLMGITPKDYDLTSNALANESKDLLLKHHFRVLETGIKHGTITALKNNQSYEITTFRIEKGHIKHRKPKELVFSARLTDDLKRRDFSMNAIAYSPTKGLIDPFKGQNAIENQMIECVGEARLRFFEDALRILRALRFSATLGFKIVLSTKEAVFACKDLLKHLSKERLQNELDKLLMGKNAYEVAKEYQEILELVTQEKIENLGFLKNAPFNLELRLLGFFKHQKSLENLRYPKKTCVLFLKAKECHKAFLNIHNKTELKFLLKNYDLEPFNLALDFYALKNPKHALKIKGLLKEIFNASEPFKKEHLALKGSTLQSLGYQHQKIGEILNACLDLIIENPKNNALEWLIKWVKDHYLPNDAINLSPIGKKKLQMEKHDNDECDPMA